jgi:hypothetical protein
MNREKKGCKPPKYVKKIEMDKQREIKGAEMDEKQNMSARQESKIGLYININI